MPGEPAEPGIPGIPGDEPIEGNWAPLADTFTSTPDSLPDSLPELEDEELPALEASARLGEEEPEPGRPALELAPGMEGEPDCDPGDPGIEGEELDEEEDEPGMPGGEPDEPLEELDDEDGAPGMLLDEELELLELEDVVSQPARMSPSAETVMKARTCLRLSGLFMAQTLSPPRVRTTYGIHV